MLDKAVDDVELTEGSDANEGKQVLKITWNTDAGSKVVEIPLEKIFDPSNYYTKQQVDDELKKYAKTDALDDFLTEDDFKSITTTQIDSLFT